jgi:hypothetical protein
MLHWLEERKDIVIGDIGDLHRRPPSGVVAVVYDDRSSQLLTQFSSVSIRLRRLSLSIGRNRF